MQAALFLRFSVGTTLESQMIHMIQELFGQTLNEGLREMSNYLAQN